MYNLYYNIVPQIFLKIKYRKGIKIKKYIFYIFL